MRRPPLPSRRSLLAGLVATAGTGLLLERQARFPAEIRRGLGPADEVAMRRVLGNYGRKVDVLSDARDLPGAYFKALIILESGGKRSPGHRFEPHVFRRLQAVRDGRRREMEGLTARHLDGASDDALRNLATSWGPLQLMGYHCVGLGVQVADLRTAKGLQWAIAWSDKAYGSYLRRGRLRDAFHMHNTGRPYPRIGRPRTHAPDYVPRGLRYVRAFEQLAGQA